MMQDHKHKFRLPTLEGDEKMAATSNDGKEKENLKGTFWACGDTALLWAAKAGRSEAVGWLLRHGASVNLARPRFQEGITPSPRTLGAHRSLRFA